MLLIFKTFFDIFCSVYLQKNKLQKNKAANMECTMAAAYLEAGLQCRGQVSSGLGQGAAEQLQR